MPMPLPNSVWPPPQLDGIISKLAEWDALWVGTPEALEGVYSSHRRSSSTPELSRPGFGGRLIGRLSGFWARQSPDTAVGPLLKSHVPIGSDIAQASADILWAEPPAITSDDPATQVFIDALVDDGLFTQLSAAAEVGAALGGSYRVAVWDVAASRVFTTRVDADMALPEFYYGRLRAVTFWRNLSVKDETYIRHLERHELNANGDGVIIHRVFSGTADNLGRLQPIDPGSPLAPMIPLLVNGDTIETKCPGLAVVYVPNQTPNRVWRKHSVGSNLGRSDFDGVEVKMDELDEAWSSLMHELDLAKARIIVPQHMLTTHSAGEGQSFDGSRTIFTGLTIEAGESGDPAPLLIQPAIRVDEHLRIMQECTEVILRSAGYSLQTFGEDETGGAATATEVVSRDRRTSLTRQRKIRHEKPALVELVTKMLALAKVHLGAKVIAEGILVEFPKAAQVSPLENAQIIQFLAVAEAASTETKVRMAHPEWEDPEVEAEVAAILDVVTAPDPTTLGQNGEGIGG